MRYRIEPAVPRTSYPCHAASQIPVDDKIDDDSVRHEAAAAQMIRILIVEDEIFVAMHAEEILTAAGHKVVGTASCADDAVAKAADLLPDLVLMDIRLHGSRDGVDAAAEIRRRFEIAVVFMTANVDSSTHARAMRVGPLRIISKPFTSDSLLGAVEAITKG